MACFHGLREELSRVIRTCATFYVLDSNLFKSVSAVIDLESSTLEMQHLIKLYSGNNNLILRSHQFQDKEYLEMQEDAIEEELLVKVPGSACWKLNLFLLARGFISIGVRIGFHAFRVLI